MAYENETFHQQCDRIISKLKETCERPVEGEPCGKTDAVEFEDCCLPCQAARTIYFARTKLPSPEEWARTRRQTEEFQLREVTRLGGYG